MIKEGLYLNYNERHYRGTVKLMVPRQIGILTVY